MWDYYELLNKLIENLWNNQTDKFRNPIDYYLYKVPYN